MTILLSLTCANIALVQRSANDGPWAEGQSTDGFCQVLLEHKHAFSCLHIINGCKRDCLAQSKLSTFWYTTENVYKRAVLFVLRVLMT